MKLKIERSKKTSTIRQTFNKMFPYLKIEFFNSAHSAGEPTSMKNILPTGGEGTLRSLFINDKGFVFAKTGTLSNHTSLSGYIVTKKNKLLIFSLQANHFLAGATPVRLAFERFITFLRNQY